MTQVYKQSQKFYLKTIPDISLSFFSIVGYLAGVILIGYDTNCHVWVIKGLPLWAKIGFTILLVSLIIEILWVVTCLVRSVKKVGDLEITKGGLKICLSYIICNLNWDEIADIKVKEEDSQIIKIHLKNSVNLENKSKWKFFIKRYLTRGARELNIMDYLESNKLQIALLESKQQIITIENLKNINKNSI